jgi:hypothetical protein
MAADTWGLSWGGTTGSWLTSWASTFVPPTPEPETGQTPAGRPKKRRYFVEVDGQLFFAEDEQHARAILDRAAELAEKSLRSRSRHRFLKPAPRLTCDRMRSESVTRTSARKSLPSFGFCC